MALLEILGIAATLIVSLFDLIVNVFAMCMSGYCKSNCCEWCQVEHIEDGNDDLENKLSESDVQYIKDVRNEK